MKKNDWILTTAVALYSFLFYQQSAGINFVLFTIGLLVCLVQRDSSILKNTKWRIAAFGSLLSSFCIGYYGNSLSVIANIISLSLLSGLSLNSKTSVVLSLLFSFYSYFSAPVLMFIDRIERKKKESSTQSNIILKKVILIAIPILITLLFFFMYRSSNALFNDFSKNLNLNFISFNWILFTLGGFILLYGFFYHKKIEPISDIDENAPNELSSLNHKSITLFGKGLSIDDEIFSGNLLFILLNLLLLVVNILDINFMFINGKLPEGISFSEFVHQGIGMLIISILFAITIILFYFRGSLNFSYKSKTIKLLAYLWILQNAFMLISTSQRNGLYIHEFGLTYKRIGVYVYLILTLIGLSTTFIKILKKKTNNYLFRINGWLFYIVLILSCAFNWDRLIINFNIHKAIKLEKNYLLSLSSSSLPELFKLQQDTTIHIKEFTLIEKRNLEDESYSSVSINEVQDFDSRLSQNLLSFLQEREALNWKSWNYENVRVYDDLIALNKSQKIKTLKLSLYYHDSISMFKEFSNITELTLNTNRTIKFKELYCFNQLKKLDLQSFNLCSIMGIEAFQNLEYLDLSKNFILNYQPLYSLKKLKELHIGNISSTQFEKLKINLPNTRIVKL